MEEHNGRRPEIALNPHLRRSPCRRNLAVSLLFLSCISISAKDRKKALLPADILQAQTVLVVIDPNAGVDIQKPNANTAARDDVEKALMKWGRFTPVTSAITADLIITVRKGNGKIAQPTIGGLPTNNRPVILQPTDSGGRVGMQRGNPGTANDPANSQPTMPHPQAEVGSTQDIFVVYRGNKNNPDSNPLDAPPAWRYSAKDALQSPGVPAVDEFRKLVDESEKQLNKTP